MQLIKPLKQSAIYKVYEFMRRYYLSVGVLSAFYFDEDGELCTEQHMWERISKEYGKQPLDYSMPKPVGEVLIRGHAYAPAGTSVTGREAWFTVGGLTRRIYVLGERYWRDAGVLGHKPSEPQPFSRMSLGWENAYGGPGFAQNPLGKGHAPVEIEPGKKMHLLPNLLDPEKPQQEPGEELHPVCFDAISYEWPQRMSLAGTYDDQWKQHYFPGLAADIDWSIFNSAQPEQRLKEGFFRGDETFELGGMHPDEEIIHGRLPGVRSRAFLNFTGAPAVEDGDERFSEIPMRLDTVTFFPDLKMGVICWRGMAEVYSEDTAEVGQLLVAYEKMADPQRELAHYRQENENRRFKPGRLPTAMLNEAPLIPLGARSGFSDMLEESKKFAQAPVFENAKRRVAAAMKDVDRLVQITGTQEQVEQAFGEIPLPPDLSPDRLHEADIEGYLKKKQEYALKKSAERDQVLGMMTKIMGDKMLSEPTPLFSGAKAVRGLGVFESMRGLPGLEGLDKMPAPPVLAERFAELQDLTRKDERRTGYLKPKFRLRGAEEQKLLRARLLDELRRGNPLRDQEFSACDFTGMNFTGVDLRGIDLRSCILSGCNFEGADLREAILSHADLRGANCRNVRAQDCGLSGTNLRDALFAGADLSGAGFGGAVLSGGDFSGARFDGAQVMEGDWSQADFTGASFVMVQAMKTDFSRAKFTEAKLTRCNFMECPMERSDFTHADLRQVSFVNQNTTGSCFREARLHRVVFSNLQTGDMQYCDFAGSEMETVNFQNNNLQWVSFKLARLMNCCFMNSDLRRCCLRGVDARGSIFRRCNLEGTDFSAANLANASLRLACLVKTDFTGSNLIQADLLKSQLGQTIFTGANLKRTIMKDWRPGENYGRGEGF